MLVYNNYNEFKDIQFLIFVISKDNHLEWANDKFLNEYKYLWKLIG